MGTQCSCTSNLPSKSTEIDHCPETATQHTSNNISPPAIIDPSTGQDGDTHHANRSKSQAAPQEKERESAPHKVRPYSQPDDLRLKSKVFPKQKPKRKKMKKIVQVMISSENNRKEEEFESLKIFPQRALTQSQTQVVIKTMKKHFILSQLSSDQLKYIVKKMKFFRIQKDFYVFKQGDQSFSYYIILEGTCSVHINEERKRVLEPGSGFGDLGIIYNAPRSASILAENNCVFAELSSSTFRRIINDLNAMYEHYNRKILENLEFYNCLTEPQKNVLAANCLVEVYEAGQMIFHKGDDANAFYLIKQGIVTVMEKNIDLKAGESVGVNAIINTKQSSSVRSNSLIAKSNCKLLSLTRELIKKNLGDSIANILRKNLVIKILKESDIWEMFEEGQWISRVEKMQINTFNKGDVVFKKGTNENPGNLLFVLKADVRSKKNPKSLFYIANSIVQPNRFFKKVGFVFEDDYEATGDCQVGTIFIPKDKVKGVRTEKALKNNRSIYFEDLVVVRTLRSGNFGTVYAVCDKNTKNKYALKVMNKLSLSQNVLPYIEKETQLLASLPQHPFFINYYQTLHHQNMIMIAMQLIEGEDLFDALYNRLPLREDDTLFYISQLILVMEHLHENNVIYRDLKPENVMLDKDGYLILVDMGTAKKMTIENRFKTSTIIGTPHYMAPEILLGKGYTFTVDWWSLGIVMYEMVTGRLPYGENLQDPFAVYQEIIRNELTISCSLTSPCREVLNQLLIKNMGKRLRNGSSGLKEMKFFKMMNWVKLLKKEWPTKIYPSFQSEISNQEIEKCLSAKKSLCVMQLT